LIKPLASSAITTNYQWIVYNDVISSLFGNEYVKSCLITRKVHAFMPMFDFLGDVESSSGDLYSIVCYLLSQFVSEQNLTNPAI